MMLVFFNSQRMVCTNYVPKGDSVNGNFIAGALRTFLKHLKKMMPEMVERGSGSSTVMVPWCTL
jgi:hypothetical protein